MEQFLPSVIQNSRQAEIIIADNCSTDDSVEWLKNEYPDLKIIINEKNEGFANGYNQALKKVDAEIFVLLNSDVEVSKDWLLAPLTLLEEESDVGAIQPKIRAYNDKQSFEYAGAAGGFIDKYGFPFCRGRLFENLEKDNGQYNKRSEIFWATGACMFIRADIFKAFGGFDKRFFAHMEEIDLCWRIKNAGHLILYEPASTVYHLGGGTLDKAKPQKTFLNFRNNLFMLHKNLPQGKVFKHIFIKLMLDGIAAVKLLFDLGPSHVIAIIRAHYAFFVSIAKCRKIRNETRASARKTLPSAMYNSSIVFDHYLSGKKTFSELEKQKFTGS